MFCFWRYRGQLNADKLGSYHDKNGENVNVYILKNETSETFSMGFLMPRILKAQFIVLSQETVGFFCGKT